LSGTVPSSVTVTVTLNVANAVPACAAVGIHVNTPLAESICMPAARDAGSSEKVKVSASVSVAVAVKVSGVKISVRWSPIAASTGASLTGLTVTFTVTVSKPPRPSAT